MLEIGAMKKILNSSGGAQSYNFGQGGHSRPFEKMIFKQRLGGDEGVSHSGIWGKTIPDKENRKGFAKCKGFEARACLELRNSKEANVYRQND